MDKCSSDVIIIDDSDSTSDLSKGKLFSELSFSEKELKFKVDPDIPNGTHMELDSSDETLIKKFYGKTSKEMSAPYNLNDTPIEVEEEKVTFSINKISSPIMVDSETSSGGIDTSLTETLSTTHCHWKASAETSKKSVNQKQINVSDVKPVEKSPTKIVKCDKEVFLRVPVGNFNIADNSGFISGILSCSSPKKCKKRRSLEILPPILELSVTLDDEICRKIAPKTSVKFSAISKENKMEPVSNNTSFDVSGDFEDREKEPVCNSNILLDSEICYKNSPKTSVKLSVSNNTSFDVSGDFEDSVKLSSMRKENDIVAVSEVGSFDVSGESLKEPVPVHYSNIVTDNRSLVERINDYVKAVAPELKVRDSNERKANEPSKAVKKMLDLDNSKTSIEGKQNENSGNNERSYQNNIDHINSAPDENKAHSDVENNKNEIETCKDDIETCKDLQHEIETTCSKNKLETTKDVVEPCKNDIKTLKDDMKTSKDIRDDSKTTKDELNNCDSQKTTIIEQITKIDDTCNKKQLTLRENGFLYYCIDGTWMGIKSDENNEKEIEEISDTLMKTEKHKVESVKDAKAEKEMPGQYFDDNGNVDNTELDETSKKHSEEYDDSKGKKHSDVYTGIYCHPIMERTLFLEAKKLCDNDAEINMRKEQFTANSVKRSVKQMSFNDRKNSANLTEKGTSSKTQKTVKSKNYDPSFRSSNERKMFSVSKTNTQNNKVVDKRKKCLDTARLKGAKDKILPDLGSPVAIGNSTDPGPKDQDLATETLQQGSVDEALDEIIQVHRNYCEKGIAPTSNLYEIVKEKYLSLKEKDSRISEKLVHVLASYSKRNILQPYAEVMREEDLLGLRKQICSHLLDHVENHKDYLLPSGLTTVESEVSLINLKRKLNIHATDCNSDKKVESNISVILKDENHNDICDTISNKRVLNIEELDLRNNVTDEVQLAKQNEEDPSYQTSGVRVSQEKNTNGFIQNDIENIAPISSPTRSLKEPKKSCTCDDTIMVCSCENYALHSGTNIEKILIDDEERASAIQNYNDSSELNELKLIIDTDTSRESNAKLDQTSVSCEDQATRDKHAIEIFKESLCETSMQKQVGPEIQKDLERIGCFRETKVLTKDVLPETCEESKTNNNVLNENVKYNNFEKAQKCEDSSTEDLTDGMSEDLSMDDSQTKDKLQKEIKINMRPGDLKTKIDSSSSVKPKLSASCNKKYIQRANLNSKEESNVNDSLKDESENITNLKDSSLASDSGVVPEVLIGTSKESNQNEMENTETKTKVDEPTTSVEKSSGKDRIPFQEDKTQVFVKSTRIHFDEEENEGTDVPKEPEKDLETAKKTMMDVYQDENLPLISAEDVQPQLGSNNENGLANIVKGKVENETQNILVDEDPRHTESDTEKENDFTVSGLSVSITPLVLSEESESNDHFENGNDGNFKSESVTNRKNDDSKSIGFGLPEISVCLKKEIISSPVLLQPGSQVFFCQKECIETENAEDMKEGVYEDVIKEKKIKTSLKEETENIMKYKSKDFSANFERENFLKCLNQNLSQVEEEKTCTDNKMKEKNLVKNHPSSSVMNVTNVKFLGKKTKDNVGDELKNKYLIVEEHESSLGKKVEDTQIDLNVDKVLEPEMHELCSNKNNVKNMSLERNIEIVENDKMERERNSLSLDHSLTCEETKCTQNLKTEVCKCKGNCSHIVVDTRKSKNEAKMKQKEPLNGLGEILVSDISVPSSPYFHNEFTRRSDNNSEDVNIFSFGKFHDDSEDLLNDDLEKNMPERTEKKLTDTSFTQKIINISESESITSFGTGNHTLRGRSNESICQMEVNNNNANNDCDRKVFVKRHSDCSKKPDGNDGVDHIKFTCKNSSVCEFVDTAKNQLEIQPYAEPLDNKISQSKRPLQRDKNANVIYLIEENNATDIEKDTSYELKEISVVEDAPVQHKALTNKSIGFGIDGCDQRENMKDDIEENRDDHENDQADSEDDVLSLLASDDELDADLLTRFDFLLISFLFVQIWKVTKVYFFCQQVLQHDDLKMCTL